MNLLAIAALGAGGYYLFEKAKKSTVYPFEAVTGGVTKKPWKTRVIAITGSGEQKKTTVEVWAPAGAWGPHLDLLVTTYQQTGSDKNSRVSLGTGANALPEMVTAAGQDFGIKKPTTTVSGAPDHLVPLMVAGNPIGSCAINHVGSKYQWTASVGNGNVIGGTAPTPGTAVRAATVGVARRQRRRH